MRRRCSLSNKDYMVYLYFDKKSSCYRLIRSKFSIERRIIDISTSKMGTSYTYGKYLKFEDKKRNFS